MGAVLVTGGTGDLGRHVVELLSGQEEVRVLSRHATPGFQQGFTVVHGDLVSEAGVDLAVQGVSTIIHCASNPRNRDDLTAARHLVEAAARAGVNHLIYISIVGVDKSPFAYYRVKLQTEEIIAGGPVPWTILRATQFHSLILRLWQAQKRLPVLIAPRGFLIQPIETSEVASRLVELSTTGPAGRVADMGGPEVWRAEDLAHRYAQVRGLRRPVLALPLPGGISRAVRAGAQITRDHAVGRCTWDEYLQQQFGSAARRGHSVAEHQR